MNTTPPDGLHRGLKARHIELITLVELLVRPIFRQVKSSVNWGQQRFLAYILGGVIIYLTMLCMGD